MIFDDLMTAPQHCIHTWCSLWTGNPIAEFMFYNYQMIAYVLCGIAIAGIAHTLITDHDRPRKHDIVEHYDNIRRNRCALKK